MDEQDVNTLSGMMENLTADGATVVELDNRNVYRVKLPAKAQHPRWGEFFLIVEVDGEEMVAVVQPLARRYAGTPYLSLDVHAFHQGRETGAEVRGMTRGRSFDLRGDTGITGVHGRPGVSLTTVMVGPSM